ncbi:hypothetical protein [Nocardia spumae]|uniref:hypothetical protein n=1 Tax=Nocardia spumae TaxID=2887190 RepID=UPI001D15CDBE|nr:hypothetical protein [Nocardia spumae]
MRWKSHTGSVGRPGSAPVRIPDAARRLVVTSLLGAGMLMHCGVFVRDGELVAGAWGRRSCPDVAGGSRATIPGVGEHAKEVLRELGFDDKRVEELLATEVARQAD